MLQKLNAVNAWYSPGSKCSSFLTTFEIYKTENEKERERERERERVRESCSR